MCSRPRADEVFTGRDVPLSTLRNFLGRLYESNVRGEDAARAPLLHFFGVGGVGKTTLLKQATSEFLAVHKMDTDIGMVHIASLDFHGQLMGKRLPGHELLWVLRNALQHANCETPLFDSVFLLLWADAHPEQAMTLPRPSRAWVEAGINVADLAGGGVAKFAHALWDRIRVGRQQKNVADRFGTHPASWTREERQERLGELLWADLADALDENKLLRIALLVDEYC